ncbi:hypothetical protein BB561_004633 [Smittium simulii]|uniref:Pre-mRNA-splicing factor CWC15 n=1 Tax=Smittium simulii TaxID=133385 RepID=A0A2T9YF43_9FUNG|nr:hypothetical protein BB561_004633 [Smittium simulii]
MTTAARPTFDTARGRDSIATSLQISARDLPGHTKLKYRKPGQGGEADPIDENQLREQLLLDEKESLEKAKKELFGHSYNDDVKKIQYNQGNSTIDLLEDEKNEYLKKVQTKYASSDYENSDENQSDSNSSGDSDSEDETALLMKELEKIKKERELEKQKREREEKELELEDNHDEIMSGNPLLAQDLNFSVKKRWDEDVVFKNQARDMQLKPQKRFINDMLRSDFHRKFMKRYIH